MSTLPVLYSFRRCPFAIRARLALAASGSGVELREVVLRDKPAALLSASPKATVPVLVLANGDVLDQSLTIMHWALSQHDPHGWLALANAHPQDAPDPQALIASCDGAFKQTLDRCKYPERDDARVAMNESTATDAWEQALGWLQGLEAHLRRAHWLGGMAPSLADAAIFPFVRQFAAIDAQRWQAMPLPQLRQWLDAWLHCALFNEVMEKHAPWREGDAPLHRFQSAAPAAHLPRST